MNWKFIIKSMGSILILETVFLLMATGIAFLYGDGDETAFVISSAIMGVTGLILLLTGRRANEYHAGRREGMLTVSLIWVVLSFFGMLPFIVGGYITDVTDAFFETMSGYTTTGATVVNNIDILPHGILFWRSLMQWQGGIGVIVFTVALLPMFGGGASYLYDSETTGFSHDRFRPRVTEVAKRLSGVYILLTVISALLLWAGPMDWFDALNHAMSSISTGGYSTRNAGVSFWNSPYTEFILMLTMCLGSLKLPLFFFALKGDVAQLRKDEETRWFLFYILIMIALTICVLIFNGYRNGNIDILTSVRKGAFQVISLASTTGFTTVDYVEWGQFFWLIAVILMMICGCGGSTSGGIKMGRAMLIIKNMLNEFRKQTHPTAILPVRVNGRAVSQETIHRVHVFVIVYLLIIVFSWALLLACGLTFDEALGTAMTAISNVGPSLGLLESGNMYDIPIFAKWYVAFLMIVGRLEIFTVLTLLLPGFWKR
ncbi:MAG: TrkH family potassium uptake protein [Tannerella sp.]|jgi:trk system potassium uptake protein TrkH|nr:TrkH family potassium uptake protein [Tannerella sp.]